MVLTTSPRCFKLLKDIARDNLRLFGESPLLFAGVMIVLAMGLIAVPTLGVSLIFMLWGVFLIKERPICQECGWMPTDKRR